MATCSIPNVYTSFLLALTPSSSFLQLYIQRENRYSHKARAEPDSPDPPGTPEPSRTYVMAAVQITDGNGGSCYEGDETHRPATPPSSSTLSLHTQPAIQCVQ
ncbi:hypothetical protein E2C01_002909 [Portunus trituberculatus]|uniref:Uncharacterized protein n=1 Tax=Portunus trituberculatus TaxID=210409 RepID=A0A5B7CKZ4_PORTR|nr:hypothetical protein [Portunus trituberculatus]